jgi:hypothetical protein
MSPCLHVSKSSCLYVSISQFLHFSISPFLLVSMSPCQCLHVSMSPSPYLHVSVSMSPCFRDRKRNKQKMVTSVLFSANGKLLFVCCKRKRKTKVCFPWGRRLLFQRTCPSMNLSKCVILSTGYLYKYTDRLFIYAALSSGYLYRCHLSTEHRNAV